MAGRPKKFKVVACLNGEDAVARVKECTGVEIEDVSGSCVLRCIVDERGLEALHAITPLVRVVGPWREVRVNPYRADGNAVLYDVWRIQDEAAKAALAAIPAALIVSDDDHSRYALDIALATVFEATVERYDGVCERCSSATML